MAAGSIEYVGFQYGRVQTEYGDGEWMIDGDGELKWLTVRTPNAMLHLGTFWAQPCP